jgi:hypothetical protein
MAEKVLSIVPRLRPAICGVSEFGWLLSQSWQAPGASFSHLVVDGASRSRACLHSSNIEEVAQSSKKLEQLITAANPDRLLLHYANRGYHRYGLPFWLSRGISRWRRHNNRSKLITIFHEVSGPLPLRSHHGLIAFCDRMIIRSLARNSSMIITNAEDNANKLSSITGHQHIKWFPVSSIIPKPLDKPRFVNRREKHFLIFGLPNTQLQTIRLFAENLVEWSEAGKLEVLHIVGPKDEAVAKATAKKLAAISSETQLIWHGELSAPKVSSLLASVGFCLSGISTENFSKSTTFMAYASHACPIVAKISSSLEPLSFLVSPKDICRFSFGFYEASATALGKWYEKQASIESLAKLIAAS